MHLITDKNYLVTQISSRPWHVNASRYRHLIQRLTHYIPKKSQHLILLITY